MEKKGGRREFGGKSVMVVEGDRHPCWSAATISPRSAEVNALESRLSTLGPVPLNTAPTASRSVHGNHGQCVACVYR